MNEHQMVEDETSFAIDDAIFRAEIGIASAEHVPDMTDMGR